MADAIPRPEIAAGSRPWLSWALYTTVSLVIYAGGTIGLDDYDYECSSCCEASRGTQLGEVVGLLVYALGLGLTSAWYVAGQGTPDRWPRRLGWLAAAVAIQAIVWWVYGDFDCPAERHWWSSEGAI